METLQPHSVQENAKSIYRNSYAYSLGIFLLGLSTALFVYTSLFVSPANKFGFFWIHYPIAGFYTLIVLSDRKLSWPQLQFNKLPEWLLAGQLWLISCFSLNNELRIFQDSTLWLQVALFIAGLSCVSLGFWESLPAKIKKIVVILFAASTLLYAYAALYLIPFYISGAIGIIAIGLGFHVFVPLWLCILLIKVCYQHISKHYEYRPAIMIGIIIPVLAVTLFVKRWNLNVEKLEKALDQSQLDYESDLPMWARIAQQFDEGWVATRILKTPEVYMDSKGVLGSSFQMSRINTDEIKEHDPMVVIASVFKSSTPLLETEKNKLLENLYDARHETQDRLWSGRNLKVTNVLTSAKINAAHRLAYTEKTLTIVNQAKWGMEEAIFTFYMPEGATVTSMSLWVNGEERPSVLTTPSKATFAYTSIVGTEKRDPSVVHWQEGQTVSVKVFPCTFTEPRRVKIGYTTPLRLENNKLIYENAYFKGPSVSLAKETIKLEFSEKATGIETPFQFETTNERSMMVYGDYKPYWEIKFDTTAIDNHGFVFENKKYTAVEYKKQYEKFDPTDVYFDLHEGWSEDDFKSVLKLFNSKKRWVYAGQWQLLDDNNAEYWFDKLSENRFSLLPLYQIPNPQNAIVVTMSTSKTPLFSDLKDSDFALKIKDWSTKHQRLRVFDLASKTSPYWLTNKQLGLIELDKGNFQTLATNFNQGLFLKPDNVGEAVLTNANLKIVETPADSTLPSSDDHLYRLFAYHEVMRQIGSCYFEKSNPDSNVVALAAKAHVLSPFSSMIVLETAKDYERFDIKASKGALGNATHKKQGAVPEPHEWALIGLAAILIFWTYFKQR